MINTDFHRVMERRYRRERRKTFISVSFGALVALAIVVLAFQP